MRESTRVCLLPSEVTDFVALRAKITHVRVQHILFLLRHCLCLRENDLDADLRRQHPLFHGVQRYSLEVCPQKKNRGHGGPNDNDLSVFSVSRSVATREGDGRRVGCHCCIAMHGALLQGMGGVEEIQQRGNVGQHETLRNLPTHSPEAVPLSKTNR